MSAEFNIVQRVTEVTINERTVVLTKGWSGELTSVQVPSYTQANVPSASSCPRHIIFISDVAGGVLAYSDGTNWKS